MKNKDMILRDMSIKELIEVLKNRDGIYYEVVEPHIDKHISVCGPAIILTIID